MCAAEAGAAFHSIPASMPAATAAVQARSSAAANMFSAKHCARSCSLTAKPVTSGGWCPEHALMPGVKQRPQREQDGAACGAA